MDFVCLGVQHNALTLWSLAELTTTRSDRVRRKKMLGTLVASLRRAPPLLHAWPRALSLLSQQRAYVSVTQARMKIFGWWEPEGAASTPFNGLNRLRRRGWIGEKVRFTGRTRARARAGIAFLWLRPGARFSRPG